MTLKELTKNLSTISDLYAKKFFIERSADWHLLKIQEELGELCAVYLQISGRARVKEKSDDVLKQNLEDELADVLAMTFLFAESQGIDPEKAIRNKWYKYLEKNN